MADSSGSPLPDFGDPPVVETVLSVQFEKLNSLTSAHLGVFWGKVRQRFPKAEEHPPLEPVLEQLDTQLQMPARIRFVPQEGSFEQRLLLINGSGTEIIQVQNGRFIKNWRKIADDNEYPRYEHAIKPGFQRDFNLFTDFLADERLGPIRINQCEVTYVNHIVAGRGWKDLSDADKIFSFWRPPTGSFPGAPTEFGAHMRFTMRNESGTAFGRLHVDISPALRNSDSAPMYVMNLTARGQIGNSFDFFDLGREWVVKSFKSLTTPHMHTIWKERNDGNGSH